MFLLIRDVFWCKSNSQPDQEENCTQTYCNNRCNYFPSAVTARPFSFHVLQTSFKSQVPCSTRECVFPLLSYAICPDFETCVIKLQILTGKNNASIQVRLRLNLSTSGGLKKDIPKRQVKYSITQYSTQVEHCHKLSDSERHFIHSILPKPPRRKIPTVKAFPSISGTAFRSFVAKNVQFTEWDSIFVLKILPVHTEICMRCANRRLQEWRPTMRGYREGDRTHFLTTVWTTWKYTLWIFFLDGVRNRFWQCSEKPIVAGHKSQSQWKTVNPQSSSIFILMGGFALFGPQNKFLCWSLSHTDFHQQKVRASARAFSLCRFLGSERKGEGSHSDPEDVCKTILCARKPAKWQKCWQDRYQQDRIFSSVFVHNLQSISILQRRISSESLTLSFKFYLLEPNIWQTSMKSSMFIQGVRGVVYSCDS